MLIRRIERFLRKTKMTMTMFGRLAMQDPRFVHDLRNGREPRPRTEQKVEHFMNIYQGDAHAN
jgi:2,4-dienoyl-CoA reductase-like NADH-dependent reductase (Old Yellow Enzyme family)